VYVTTQFEVIKMELRERLQGKDQEKLTTEVVQLYIKELEKRFENLKQDPFSGKARIAVRKEIENMKAFLHESEMENSWDSLSETFGLEVEKPQTEMSYTSAWEQGMTSSKFD
jgi:hypothetical protein